MTNGLGQGDGKYQKSRTETYHGPLTDISDTDYAMSVSRYDQIMDKSIIILNTTYTLSVTVKLRMTNYLIPNNVMPLLFHLDK